MLYWSRRKGVKVAELPTGTVTFLFTDLESSTRLWEEQPEAMRAALARHDDILAAAVEAEGGQVVKGTGDGLHAVFASPEAAVGAAVEAQRRLADEPWGDAGPLRVRMGLHSGTAERRGADYFGPVLNRAARIMAVGHGGQVLCSQAAADLARDGLPDGTALLDLGEHRLRDLSRSERVFQLRAPGLADGFPPLRSLNAYQSNLPLQVTSFVGREEALAKVMTALDAARLVTLTGVGGVGKTRLAIHVAAELLPRFPDGAWLCELAAAGDSDALVQVVGATLGVQQRPTMSLERSILEFLRAKDLLLVLDNCEHLLDEASRLAEGVLHECPTVRILATSREGLAVEGEQVWPLRSLPLATAVSPSEVAASGAGQLFEERARAVAPGFAIDARSAGAVGEICRRLDGIPLAIELAAARVASMSPTEIAGLLDERFRLLTGGRRTAVERHSTLRATVEWSYALLEPNEREVFNRLGVFSGSFDSAAASAVVAGEGVDPWDVVDAMASLVAKSMVNAEQTPEEITRYSMLETLRQFARERLDETGGSDSWRRRHAAHYAALAEAFAPELTGPGELTARRRLGLELDNVRAAVTWALDSPAEVDAELGLGIIAHLELESVTSMSSGVGAWALRAVPRVGGSTPARRQAVLGAAAYYALGCLGDFGRGWELAQRGVAEGVTELEGKVATLAHVALAQNYMATGDIDKMRAVFDECLRGADVLVDDGGYTRASILSCKAVILMAMGATNEAKKDADAAIVAARRCQNPTCLCLSYFAVGWAWMIDDPDRALTALDESVALSRAGANNGAYGSALSMAAFLRARRGEELAAIEALHEAIAASHEVGDLMNLAGALRRAPSIIGELGYLHLAAVCTGIIAGHHLHAWTMIPFPPEELAYHRSIDVRIRAELGQTAYETAMTQGAAMTASEIVNYTLGELDRIRAELGAR